MSPASARHIALFATALIVSAAVMAAPAWAQEPSTGDIVKSLQPKTKFRAFDPNQAAKDAKQADLIKAFAEREDPADHSRGAPGGRRGGRGQ
jgi:hypothetical protein